MISGGDDNDNYFEQSIVNLLEELNKPKEPIVICPTCNQEGHTTEDCPVLKK